MSSCVGIATGHMTSWQSADSWYQCQVSCSSCQGGLSTPQSQWVRSYHIWLTIWIEWVKFCIYLSLLHRSGSIVFVSSIGGFHPFSVSLLGVWEYGVHLLHA